MAKSFGRGYGPVARQTKLMNVCRPRMRWSYQRCSLHSYRQINVIAHKICNKHVLFQTRFNKAGTERYWYDSVAKLSTFSAEQPCLPPIKIFLKKLYFRTQCIYMSLMVGDQLDAQFFYIILLFQSSTCFEQTRAHHHQVNCINTASGIVTLCKWPSGRQVELDLHTGRPFTESEYTRCRINP